MTIAEAINEITMKSHLGAEHNANLLKWSLTAARMGQFDVLHWLYTNEALPYLPDDVKKEIYGYARAQAVSGDEYAEVMYAYFLMIGYGCQQQEHAGRNMLIALAKKFNKTALCLLGCLPPFLDADSIETEDDLMYELLEYPWGPYRSMSIENCLRYNIGTQCYLDTIAELSNTSLELNHEDHLDVEDYIQESYEKDGNTPF